MLCYFLSIMEIKQTLVFSLIMRDVHVIFIRKEHYNYYLSYASYICIYILIYLITSWYFGSLNIHSKKFINTYLPLKRNSC